MNIKAFIVITIISMSMVALSGVLISSTYAVTECDATITSLPSGADVWIDGANRGKTPYLYFVGNPFSAEIRVEMEGFEVWKETINVGSFEHKLVHAELTPLQAGGAIVTNTVTSTVTTTSSTTITSTTTATTTSISTTTATTTIAANTITVTSAVTTATTLTVTSTTKETGSTVTSEVTEQVGMSVELTYGAIGVAVIAVIASAIIATRRRS